MWSLGLIKHVHNKVISETSGSQSVNHNRPTNVTAGVGGWTKSEPLLQSSARVRRTEDAGARWLLVGTDQEQTRLKRTTAAQEGNAGPKRAEKEELGKQEALPIRQWQPCCLRVAARGPPALARFCGVLVSGRTPPDWGNHQALSETHWRARPADVGDGILLGL